MKIKRLVVKFVKSVSDVGETVTERCPLGWNYIISQQFGDGSESRDGGAASKNKSERTELAFP